jgi:hypothetical protein
MFGWSMFNVDEMTSQQLAALAGGFSLRLEQMSQTNQFKRRTKSSEALTRLFWAGNGKPANNPASGEISLACSLMASLAKLT